GAGTERQASQRAAKMRVMDRRARRRVQRGGPTTKCLSISEERPARWARRPAGDPSRAVIFAARC
ncbi:MAG: hypothetical protein RID81_16860, partial [Sandaracinaceae bacterium]